MKLLAALSLQAILSLANAENPIDCFRAGTVLYGSPDTGDSVNNMDEIITLSKDHVVTSIKGCSSSNGSAQGIQMTFGVWSGSQVTNEISLTGLGDYEGGSSCETFNIPQNDMITSLEIAYSSRVNAVSFVLESGNYFLVGASSSNTKRFSFSRDSYMLFGLVGT